MAADRFLSESEDGAVASDTLLPGALASAMAVDSFLSGSLDEVVAADTFLCESLVGPVVDVSFFSESVDGAMAAGTLLSGELVVALVAGVSPLLLLFRKAPTFQTICFDFGLPCLLSSLSNICPQIEHRQSHDHP